MNFGPFVRLLSDWFANPYVIEGICGAFVIATIIVLIVSGRASQIIKRDARAVSSAIVADDALTALNTFPDSALRRYVARAVTAPVVLDGVTYRAPEKHETITLVLHDYADFRTIDAFPNIFVGAGLLLTFLGLALSLTNASIGASTGDIAVVKQSVTTLLEFSAAKFAISLFALLCSIFLGIILRRQRRKLEQVLRTLDHQLDSHYPILTSERLTLHALSPQLREQEHAAAALANVQTLLETTQVQLALQNVGDLVQEAREHTAQLTKFNSDLVIQLGAALDNKLQPMMTHLADRLETALRQMGGSIGASNETALRQLLESFVNELRAATQTDSAELQGNIQRLASDLSATSRELSERMAALFTGLESTGERFAGFLSDAGGSLRDEIGRVQASMGESLTVAVEKLNEAAARSAQESEAMLSRMTEGATSFRNSVEGGASSFVSNLQRGTDSVEAVVETFGHTVGRLEGLLDRTAAFAEVSSQRTSEKLATLHTTLTELDEGFGRVREASEPFQKAADTVRTAIDLLRVTQQEAQAKVLALQSAATSMANASDTLTSTLSRDVTRLTEGLGNSTTRLTDAVAEIAQHAESAGSTLGETIRHTLEEYERRFKGVDSELQRALEVLINTFAKTYEEIRQRVDLVDSQMAESINKLAAFNEQFGETAQDFAEGVGQLSTLLTARR